MIDLPALFVTHIVLSHSTACTSPVGFIHTSYKPAKHKMILITRAPNETLGKCWHKYFLWVVHRLVSIEKSKLRMTKVSGMLNLKQEWGGQELARRTLKQSKLLAVHKCLFRQFPLQEYLFCTVFSPPYLTDSMIKFSISIFLHFHTQ